MKYIECNLPDINFIISIPNEFYEQGCKKIFESIIPYKSNSNRYINIEYNVNKIEFEGLVKGIKNCDGNIHDSFIHQKHKEIQIKNEKYFLVDTEEYICIKTNDLNYKILVGENNDTSLNWIVRIIRELYLREKEDKEYAFMHGTGLKVNNKGILILGTSGSGKTTLAVKLLEIKGKKAFLSNDRVFINEDGNMDYFPQAVTYAMGTVKNNEHLDKYFRETKILEKRKKMDYENVAYNIDCNTPLSDVASIFQDTKMLARTRIDAIIIPQFIKEIKKAEVIDMSNTEMKKILEETNFTPDDTETLRKPWLRKRYLKRNELLEIRKYLIDYAIKNINIKKIRYGIETQAEDILKCL